MSYEYSFSSPIYTYHYSKADIIPVGIKSIHNLSDYEVTELKTRYERGGFAIFEILNDDADQVSFLTFAKKLKLGSPIIPGIYSKTPAVYESSGLNIIKGTYNGVGTEGKHRAFQTSNEQKLHCDGTVEQIGKIKTSILLCVTAASQGGETIIFNSVAAFHDLLEKNEKICLSLLDPHALKRVAINSNKEEYIGPAFSIQNCEIISRFSIDNTSDWDYGFENVEYLKDAFRDITNMINTNSPFYIETRLKKGQGIIMANDKISHGRRAFVDNGPKRIMIRGLFHRSLLN